MVFGQSLCMCHSEHREESNAYTGIGAVTILECDYIEIELSKFGAFGVIHFQKSMR